MSESQEVIEAVKLLKDRFKDNADALMGALFGEVEFTLSEMDTADEAAREKIILAARANYQNERNFHEPCCSLFVRIDKIQ